jgi:hypothetical protein
MKLKYSNHPQLPVEDYSDAIRDAVSWLGDRYLLAAAIGTRSISCQPDGLPPGDRDIDLQLKRKDTEHAR